MPCATHSQTWWPGLPESVNVVGKVLDGNAVDRDREVRRRGQRRPDPVACTHGRTGLSHVLMGSTAEALVRRAPCPGPDTSSSRCRSQLSSTGHGRGPETRTAGDRAFFFPGGLTASAGVPLGECAPSLARQTRYS